MRDELFWRKVDRSGGESACWTWLGCKYHFGHGCVRRQGKNLKAHRYAYEQLVGPIPEGMNLLHHCDNPPCCNPRHLYVGTQADNMSDKMRRGRHRGTLGQFKTHCVRGHRLPPASAQNRFGARPCRTCAREAGRRHDDKRRGRKASSSAA